MPRKIKLRKNKKPPGFYQKVVNPVETSVKRSKGLVEELKKKPSQRDPAYKPLDKYWPDI
jgi:hypothetical protein